MLLTTCRVDPKREIATVGAKATRTRAATRSEVFPRVIEEPQPTADVILVQPQITECLADSTEFNSPQFSVDLSGRISEAGQVTEAHATGIDSGAAHCLETALKDILLLPNAPGVFRVNLSRRAAGSGPGVIVDPGGVKKFE